MAQVPTALKTHKLSNSQSHSQSDLHLNIQTLTLKVSEKKEKKNSHSHLHRRQRTLVGGNVATDLIHKTNKKKPYKINLTHSCGSGTLRNRRTI